MGSHLMNYLIYTQYPMIENGQWAGCIQLCSTLPKPLQVLNTSTANVGQPKFKRARILGKPPNLS